jgi:L-asparaginase/Glu-tRNA(Gln) amidotransferase subunit D
MEPDPKNFTNILDALDLAELPETEQEEILLDLNDLIYKGTMVRLIEKMDEATRDEFAKLLDGNATEDQIEAFIEANVPEADALLQETVEEMTNDILAVTE